MQKGITLIPPCYVVDPTGQGESWSRNSRNEAGFMDPRRRVTQCNFLIEKGTSCSRDCRNGPVRMTDLNPGDLFANPPFMHPPRR